jgi:hypothetical protein
MMDFKAALTTVNSATLTESIHATLEDAVKAVSDTVDAHPEMLKGYDDLGVITDVSDGTVVIALFRMADEFILARETTDDRYADSLFAMKHERYESDGDPYMVFARWSV